jgi:AraC-like DNA-binding protein
MQISFYGTGAATKLLCGGVTFERGASNPLLAILPPVLHIGRAADRARSWVGLTTQHILSELNSAAKGADEVVTRLAGVLLIQAVRTYFEENAETLDCRWLASVRDRQIGQALVMLHREPHRPWTVMLLARRLAMSPSTLAARFKELMGEPPHRYITRLRINTAAEQLRIADRQLSEVAAVAGYRSAAAFAKSFKRRVGTTPGAYRDVGTGRRAAQLS